jgi:hypothetical protein
MFAEFPDKTLEEAAFYVPNVLPVTMVSPGEYFTCFHISRLTRTSQKELIDRAKHACLLHAVKVTDGLVYFHPQGLQFYLQHHFKKELDNIFKPGKALKSRRKIR